MYLILLPSCIYYIVVFIIQLYLLYSCIYYIVVYYNNLSYLIIVYKFINKHDVRFIIKTLSYIIYDDDNKYYTLNPRSCNPSTSLLSAKAEEGYRIVFPNSIGNSLANVTAVESEGSNNGIIPASINGFDVP